MDADWWNAHYREGHTPWDIGAPAAPLVAFFEQLKNRHQKILIPGAGNAWEAEFLHQRGFSRVFVCDWAAEPLQNFQHRVPDFPPSHLIQSDFFVLEDTFDLIVEQTFLSALHPERWPDYARKTAALLKPGGILVGVVFANPFAQPGPPFGAQEETYLAIFEPFYRIITFKMCETSIKPRYNNEFFIEMTPL